MKPSISGIYIFAVIMLLLAWVNWAKGATFTPIQDTVVNADGRRFQGNIVITWQPYTTTDGSNIPGGQKIVTVTNGLLRMQLAPYGGYTASYQPLYGPSTVEYWNVPASTLPLRLADLHTPPAIITPGVFAQPITTSMTGASVSATQHGCGANPIWRVWDNAAGWTDVDAVLDTSGNLTLNWAGTFTGVLHISCGAFVPNTSASFTTSNTSLSLPSSFTGLTTPTVVLECYDSAGNAFGLDYLISPAGDVTAWVNPTGLPQIAGRCVIGAL